jgi:hypothetical protein
MSRSCHQPDSVSNGVAKAARRNCATPSINADCGLQSSQGDHEWRSRIESGHDQVITSQRASAPQSHSPYRGARPERTAQARANMHSAETHACAVATRPDGPWIGPALILQPGPSGRNPRSRSDSDAFLRGPIVSLPTIIALRSFLEFQTIPTLPRSAAKQAELVAVRPPRLEGGKR